MSELEEVSKQEVNVFSNDVCNQKKELLHSSINSVKIVRRKKKRYSGNIDRDINENIHEDINEGEWNAGDKTLTSLDPFQNNLLTDSMNNAMTLENGEALDESNIAEKDPSTKRVRLGVAPKRIEGFQILDGIDVGSFEGTTGKIMKVRIQNFLNHKNLEMCFNPSKNIIVGRNGMGKSAIAQAIVIGLGCVGKDAGRDSKACTYIRNYDSKGSNNICIVEIVLSNSSEDAYKHNKFGDIIIIRRVITSKTNTFYMRGINRCRESEEEEEEEEEADSEEEKEEEFFSDIYENESIEEVEEEEIKDDKFFESVDINGEISEGLYETPRNSRRVKNKEALSWGFKKKKKRKEKKKAFQGKTRCKKTELDGYLNFINVNVRSPCIYLDQEKGKKFFSETHEKGLYHFYVNSMGIDIAEERMAKEKEHLKDCYTQIKNREVVLKKWKNHLDEINNRNNIIKREIEYLNILDEFYHVVGLYEILRKTILYFNEYLSLECSMDLQIVHKTIEEMRTIIEQTESFKGQVEVVLNADKTCFFRCQKNLKKIEKYKCMIGYLNDMKKKYEQSIERHKKYVSTLNEKKQNNNWWKECENKNLSESQTMYATLEIEKMKMLKYVEEISKCESAIKEIQKLIDSHKNKLRSIEDQLKETRKQVDKTKKIKDAKIRTSYHMYGYDIYKMREKVKVLCANQHSTESVQSRLDLRGRIKKARFKDMPIGPAGAYLRIKESIPNINYLSVIERHLENIMHCWFVSCYEDKKLLENILKEVETSPKIKFSVIVTNASAKIKRVGLLRRIDSMLKCISGKTIYSFFNISFLPDPLLLYLCENFNIVQTLLCDDSNELQTVIKANADANAPVRVIYIVNEMVLVKILPKGSLHYIPFLQDHYNNPVFLRNPTSCSNIEREGNATDVLDPFSDEHQMDADTSELMEEEIKNIKAKKEKVEQDCKREILELKSKQKRLQIINEKLKRSVAIQEKCSDELRKLESQNNTDAYLFEETLKTELEEKTKNIGEMSQTVEEIDKYIKTLQMKMEQCKKESTFSKFLLNSHVEYFEKRINKISEFKDKFDDLKLTLQTLNSKRKRNKEKLEIHRPKFVQSFNSLRDIYFKCLSNKIQLKDILLQNPFLDLKKTSSNEVIVDVSFRFNEHKEIEAQIDENENSFLPLVCSINPSGDSAPLNCRTNEVELKIPYCIINESNLLNLGIQMGSEEPKEEKQERVVDILDEMKNEIEEYTIIDTKKNHAKTQSKNPEHIEYLKNLDEFIHQKMHELNKIRHNRQESDAQLSCSYYGPIASTIGKGELSKGIWEKRNQQKIKIFECVKKYGFEERGETQEALDAFYNNLIENYEKKKKNYEKQNKIFCDLKENYDKQKENHELRKEAYRDTLDKTQKNITHCFKKVLNQMNGFEGHLDFNNEERTLKVTATINQNMSNNTAMNIKSLSGGEKSTIQLALLAAFSLSINSTFHIYDEVDVFMDELARVKNMKLFFSHMKLNKDKQYFFVTPHIEITELFIEDAKKEEAKIFNLSHILEG